MTKAAKKWLSEYKKLFNEVSAYNKGANAAQNAVASEGVRKIERLGRVVESGESAEFRTQNAELDDGSRKALRGKIIVDIEPNAELDELILNSTKNKADVIRLYLIGKYEGETFNLSDGRKAIMDKSDAKELAHGATADRKNQLGNLRKLVEEAKYDHAALNVEHNKFINFYYYTVTAKYRNTETDLWINVGQAKNDGKNHIYSITDKKEDAPTKYGVGRPVGNYLQNASSNSSISDSTAKSNSFDKNSSKKVDDGSRSALKKSDKAYREKVNAKADAKIQKATAKAEARADRTIETKSAQLKAEYTTDKVFSQSSVKSGFESVPEVKKLPGKERETIARDLWLELEASDSQDVRDTFILKYSVKLYYAIKNADYKAYENMTMKEKDALREKLNATVKKIVNSGRKSKGAKIREDIKAEEQVAGEIKAKIYQSLKKIDDIKKERFLAASAYKSDEFKDTLEQLTKIDWRGKFSANIARAQVKKLSEWYSEENPIVEKAKPEIEKNKKAETAGQTRLNQPSVISIPDSAPKINSSDENSSKKVDDWSSLSTAAGGPPSPVLGKAKVGDRERSALKNNEKNAPHKRLYKRYVPCYYIFISFISVLSKNYSDAINIINYRYATSLPTLIILS